jgi:hypothetical protein
MRQKVIAAAGAVVLSAALAVGLLVWPGHLPHSRTTAQGPRTPPSGTSGTSESGRAAAYAPGGPVPAQAAAVAAQLVSADPGRQRAALDPDTAAALAPGRLFPAGSSLALDPDGWHQQGRYANAAGMLREPGAAPARVELGFADTSGSWLVVFEQALS